MSRLVHTKYARVIQGETQAALAGFNATASGAVVTVSATSLTTLAASVPSGAGISVAASSPSGNSATLTLSGTPKVGDSITVTVQGRAINIEVKPTQSLAAIANDLAAVLLQRLQVDDMGFDIAFDKRVQGVTTAANCTAAGLVYNKLTDPRPTTTTTLTGAFPTSSPEIISNDLETTLNP